VKCLAALLLATLTYAQTADSLRTNLTYIASDELEGRGTPSKGLELAADYIAAQFKAAGLTPAFQTAHFAEAKTNLDGFTLTLNGTLTITADQVSIRSLVAEDISNQEISSKPSNGKIFATDSRNFQTENHPALVLLIGPDRKSPPPPAATFLDDTESPRPPTIRISSTAALNLLHAGKLRTITLHLAKPEVTPANLRNVTAILPGSDPKLSHQYVILGAHYDHLGRTEKGIFNGANDDGSGAVSVIEIAKALAASPTRPKRSILFITFFGEERGLLGSFYYASHPLVPLKDTIAEVSLEQMGRTDDNAGPQVSSFAFTGPKYTDIPALMEAAAKPEGIKTYTRPDANDFFARSDNYPFAKKHIPDTTIAVAFEYPEYHAIGDTVDKIDFENMAKVDRGVAAGILALANGKPPKFTALIP
jgi:Peptidase family M28